MLLQAAPTLRKEVDLKRTYDAIVVGSGAAGGMAAHVLTASGLEVLLLEAGKKLDIEAELKSMEWPYDHPRRGAMRYTSHALSLNEYNVRTPPYAKGLAWKTVHSYVQGWSGSDYSKNIVVNEQDHPYTGTSYAWVRARVLGGKTNTPAPDGRYVFRGVKAGDHTIVATSGAAMAARAVLVPPQPGPVSGVDLELP